MASKKKILNSDLKEVLKEMSKAPGGNVPAPRPVTPGPILGGPVEERKPGVVDPATGVRRKSDTALELFRFYAYGDVKERNLPSAPPDTKKVTVTEKPMSQKEKIYKQTLKKSGAPVQPTQERIETAKGVRGGTVGGMTRPIGSKPSVDLNNSLLAVAKKYEQMAKLREEAEVIRDAVEKAFGAASAESSGKYTPELNPIVPLTREEQKYLDLIQRRIQDAMAERNAALAEAIAQKEIEAGTYTSEYERNKAMKKAEKRTLEGRQVAERTSKSRAKTEISLKDLPGKIVGKGGSGLASLDLISMILSANLMYEQMLLEQSRLKRQIS